MTAKKKLYSFDDYPEDREQLPGWAAKWVANAMSTAPADKAKMIAAMDGLYRAADLEPPTRHAFVASPVTAAIAGSVAAGIWWLRENQPRHTELIGKDVSDSDFATAAHAAIVRLVRNGVTSLRGDTTVEARAVEAAAVAVSQVADVPLREGASDEKLTTFLVSCARHWYRMHDGGSDWSAWPAYLSFFRHVAKLGERFGVDYSKWAHYEDAAQYGASRMSHAKFWIVSDRHTSISVDDRNRLHSESGPARAWGDGWAIWYWHGVRVKRRLIEEPWTITVEQIDAERNAEIRRVMIERFGMERFIRESGAKLVGRDDWGTLWSRQMPGDDDPLVVVEVINSTPEPDGTSKVYMLRVPPEFAAASTKVRVPFADDASGDIREVARTPHAAIAWTFGLTPDEYVPTAMS